MGQEPVRIRCVPRLQHYTDADCRSGAALGCLSEAQHCESFTGVVARVNLFRRSIVAGTVMVPIASLFAQTPHFDFTLDWIEVQAETATPVGNPDGLLSPGEGALVRLSIGFSPSVGSPVSFQEPFPGGSGTVAAFASTSFNLIATAALGGTWSSLQPSPGFTIGLGFAAPDGSLVASLVTQPSPPANRENPLSHIWAAVWTPSSYQARQVSFLADPGDIDSGRPRLYAATGGNPAYGFAYGSDASTPLQISVVPAPSAAVLLLMSSMACARRRR